MALEVGYDRVMRLSLFALAFVVFLGGGYSVSTAQAQSVNWGPSVTSLGFGGSGHLGGVPPSVTSLGFGRMGSSGFNGRTHFHTPFAGTPIGNSRHHRPFFPVWGAYYAYPVLIDSDNYYQDSPAENPEEYRGGPTIFDRRGDGQYAPPAAPRRPESDQASVDTKQSTPPQPAPEVAGQPQTVLVFKDGHQANVDNYAIIGNTLYDLSGGKRHKIALADLDLKATAQQNDDRGVDFQLPTDSASN